MGVGGWNYFSAGKIVFAINQRSERGPTGLFLERERDGGAGEGGGEIGWSGISQHNQQHPQPSG